MEFVEIARIFFSLIAVIGMIGLCAVAAKKLGLQNAAAGVGRTRRLALVETLPLDQRRRAAIVSCDGREHLIILDASRVTVVERAIPPLESAETADPIAARASIEPMKPLHVPAGVMRLMHRAPQDKTMALRAAGLL